MRTWPDFESLFSRGGGWDFCWCMAFHRAHALSRKQFRTRAALSVVNHRDKRALIEQHRSHGVIVYVGGEAIGWCQYGPTTELPLHDEPPRARGPKRWRVTCFVVDKRYRRQGIAGLALRAVLNAIRKRGGGVVEARPIAAWTHGKTGTTEPVLVKGAGLVTPAHGSFGNVSWPGTVSMFENAGFHAVAPAGRCNVIMRTEIGGRRRGRPSTPPR